jgi:hypothetical protein
MGVGLDGLDGLIFLMYNLKILNIFVFSQDVLRRRKSKCFTQNLGAMGMYVLQI